CHLGAERAAARPPRSSSRVRPSDRSRRPPLRLAVGCLAPESTAMPGRASLRPWAAIPIQRQLEPRSALALAEVVTDPLDRRPVARPDDLGVRLVDAEPARVVVLVGKRRVDPVPDPYGEDRRRDDRVVRRLVELVHEIEVIERLDDLGPEA